MLNRATRDRVHPLGRDCSSCALSHVHDIYGGKLGCPVVNAGGARETGKAQEVEAWRAAATFDNDGFPTATPGPCPMWFDGAE